MQLLFFSNIYYWWTQEDCDLYIQNCFVCLDHKDKILSVIKSEVSSVDEDRRLKPSKLFDTMDQIPVEQRIDPNRVANIIAEKVIFLTV